MTANDKESILKSMLSKDYQYRSALSIITSQFIVLALLNFGFKRVEYGTIILGLITISGIIGGLFYYFRAINFKLSEPKFKIYSDLIK